MHTGPDVLAPTTPTPIDAFARRAEWEFAALVVALVLVPGLAAAMADGAETSPVRPAGAAAATSPRRAKSGHGRHVRPPRAC